jgi:hypothetical protein
MRPVAADLQCLSRPGGSITGVATLNLELGSKKLELLHELVLTATIIGLLVNPANPNNEIRSKDMQAAARILGVELDVLRASTERDIDEVFPRGPMAATSVQRGKATRPESDGSDVPRGQRGIAPTRARNCG